VLVLFCDYIVLSEDGVCVGLCVVFAALTLLYVAYLVVGCALIGDVGLVCRENKIFVGFDGIGFVDEVRWVVVDDGVFVLVCFDAGVERIARVLVGFFT